MARPLPGRVLYLYGMAADFASREANIRTKASGCFRRIFLMVIVLGIDPGTANLGYGVVLARGRKLAALDGGVVTAPASEPLERRLARIHAKLCDLIAEHKPSAVAVEDLFFGQNARTAFAVGQARGVVMLSAGLAGLPCYSYTPQAVKAAVCGTGSADKAQVQRMVQAILALPEPVKPDHASDALAVAICHAQVGRSRSLMAGVAG